MKGFDSASVETITIDDVISTTALRAFAGSVLAGAIFWAGALAVLLS